MKVKKAVHCKVHEKKKNKKQLLSAYTLSKESSNNVQNLSGKTSNIEEESDASNLNGSSNVENSEIHQTASSTEEVFVHKRNSSEALFRYISTSSDESSGILLLGCKQSVCLEGYTQLQVLYGTVEIFGFEISTTNKNIYNIYSLSSSSLFTINCIHEEKVKGKDLVGMQDFLSRVPVSAMSRSILKEIENLDVYTCIYLQQEKSVLPHVLKSLNNYNCLSRPLKIHGLDGYQDTYNTKHWLPVAQEITSYLSTQAKDRGEGTILICGGKDVGKSSLSKYLINSCLSRYETVCYLECDCGQTEFTLPGTLSLVNIKNPLLGPAFTHCYKPKKSLYFGFVSPKDHPSGYISIIKELFEYYTQHFANKAPLIVNQHGWVRGLGLNLLIDCLRIVSPHIVIQIQSNEMQSRNLQQDLSDEFIQTQKGWMTSDHNTLRDDNNLNISTKFMKIDSKSNSTLSANKSFNSRNLSISSYFSTCFNELFATSRKESFTPLLSDVRPFKVSWEDLAVHVIQNQVPRNLMLKSLNKSLVCLGKVETEMVETDKDFPDGPKFLHQDCFIVTLGFGIIRNIDFEKKLFYIITPEDSKVLEEVNVVVKGNVHLPPSYFLNTWKWKPSYYSYNYTEVSSKVGGKSKPRFNLKRKPSKLKRSMEEKT